MSDRPVIVVGVDGSPASDAAVQWTAREALVRGASLRIVSAWQSHSFFGSAFFVNPIPDSILEPERTARLNLERARSFALAINPTLEVSVSMPGGPAALTLLETAKDAEILVIGGTHRALLDRAVFGSVTTHAVTHAHCPVVVVRDSHLPESAGRRHNVVLGFDDSAEAQCAAAFAFEYAAGHGCDLLVVEAITMIPGTGPTSGDDLREVNGALLREAMAGYVARYPTLSVTTTTPLGHPSSVLLEHARSADILVVGSRGRGWFEGMLLGSVSAAVAHQSTSTVAVIR